MSIYYVIFTFQQQNHEHQHNTKYPHLNSEICISTRYVTFTFQQRKQVYQHITKHPRLNSEAYLTPVTFRPLVEEREEK